MSNSSDSFIGLAAMAFYFTMIAAWITHIIVCIKTGAWMLMFMGAIIFPVGIVHGIGSWFGVF